MSDMLFPELDIAAAKDDPWGVPDNTYFGVVTNIEVKKNKKGNYGLYITYKIRQGDYVDEEVLDYFHYPHKDNAEPRPPAMASRDQSFIKQRLGQLGIPEDQMNKLRKENVVGKEVYFRTEQRDSFTRVMEVSLKPIDSNGASANQADSTEKQNPFALSAEGPQPPF